jgi:hypothetical protein
MACPAPPAQQGRGLGLLVSVMAHYVPAVDKIGRGFAVLAGEHAGDRIPPPDRPVGGAESRQEGPVEPIAVTGETATPPVP